MKAAIETATVRSRIGDREAFRAFSEAGFDGVDFSFHASYQKEVLMRDDWREAARQRREWLDETGLFCHQCHAPFTFRFGQPMDRSCPDYDAIVRAMESASVLGAQYIVVHTVLAPAGVDLDEYNLKLFRSLLPYSEAFGVRIGFENIFDYDPTHRCLPRYGSPDTLNAFLKKLDSPQVVCCLDTGHAAIGGTKPEDFIEGMSADVLKLLHVQDTDYLDDRHQLPYMGFHNWDNIMRALAKIGYTGDLTYEIPGFYRRMDTELFPAALRFAEATARHLIRKFEDAKA